MKDLSGTVVVDGNSIEAEKLFQEYRSVLNDEITKAKQAKNQGKTKQQIALERVRRREARRHYRKLRRNMKAKGIKRPLHTASHHVVPVFDKRGTIARKILAEGNLSY